MRRTLVAIAVALGAPAAARAQTLTLEQAIARGMQASPALLAARSRVEAGQHEASAVGRRLLPAARVSGELLRYDSPFALAFPIGAPGAPPAQFVARDATTSTFVATVDEPLLGLARLNQERVARNEASAAGSADLRALENAVREQIADGFLRHFEARALEQVAGESVKELEEQLGIARARLASGVATQADVLRVETAVANARQQVIAAHSQADITRAALLAAIGARPGDRSVALVEPAPLLAWAAQTPGGTGDAAARPELEARRHEATAAEKQASARTLAMLPDVNLEASYVHIEGQKFAPKDSAYVGLKAQWAVWEWGATNEARRAARAQADAARANVEEERLRVETEIVTAGAQLEAARASVEAAERAITSAEEACRVTNVQLKAGTATTTDLIDAQTALTQARLTLARARYGVAVARVALARARGESLPGA